VLAPTLEFAPQEGSLSALDNVVGRSSLSSNGVKRASSRFRHLAFGGNLVDSAGVSGLEVPLIVSSCIKALSETSTVVEEGIFRVPGGAAEISEMRQAFERGDDPLAAGAAGHDPNAIAGLFKLYLRELSDPVLTKANYPLFVGLQQLGSEVKMMAAAKKLMETRMPAEHVAVLKVLLPFLKHVSTFKDQNRMDVPNLAMVFGQYKFPR
jgi:SLIT-ROBO Rho GTPase activating protein